MPGKSSSVNRWYCDYVLNTKKYDDLRRETPYSLVGLTPWLGYNRRSSGERFSTIDEWLRANIRPTHYTYVTLNSTLNDVLHFDHGMKKYGAIAGVMFHYATDAVMFKLALPELIHVSR